MKKMSIKTVVAVGIGAALFFVLGRFVAIPSGVPNTNISLQYAVLGLLAAMYGPVAGGLIGFIGHTLGDLSWGGSPWWSWVIASAFTGVVVGLFSKKIAIEEGTFGKKEVITFAIANVVVQSNINAFGADAMAGCGSYSKVEGFVFLPITAFAMALTTFIGQNLGAGQFDRAKQGARIGILCSMAMAELIGVALFFLAPYAMRLFNDDPAVVAIGVRQSHIEALFFCFLAFAHGVSAVLRGAGRAQVPMYTMLGCWCILRVSYITLALKVWPDIATIFWAYPITWSVSCVVFLIYYLKADWVHSFDK